MGRSDTQPLALLECWHDVARDAARGADLGAGAWPDALTLSLHHTRARALALVEEKLGAGPVLLGASLGAPHVFTSLCLSIAGAAWSVASARMVRDVGWLAWSRFQLASGDARTLCGLYDNDEDVQSLAAVALIAERCTHAWLAPETARAPSRGAVL